LHALNVQWLLDDLVDASFFALFSDLLGVVAGYCDYYGALPLWVLLSYFLCSLDAPHHRHVDIHQYKVKII
jgi:hypothetical protein